jgi:hypothetical protein
MDPANRLFSFTCLAVAISVASNKSGSVQIKIWYYLIICHRTVAHLHENPILTTFVPIYRQINTDPYL